LFNEAEVTTTEIGPGDEPLPSKNEEKENTRPLIVEKISPEAKLPTRAHETDAGLDLYATDCYSIPPYSQALVATGIKIALPEGYVGLIWDKSGLANQGLTTMGGVIDTGYRGEIKVVFKNLSEDIYNIIPGQKIAQLLIQKIALPEIQEGSVNPDTARQTGGFGSSGRF
jgi:dUTP pyrophosphatase